MASVVKDKVKRNGKPRSPFWYACYTDSRGNRCKKSTKLTSKSKAEEVARTLQKASDEARRGVLTEARIKELLSDVLKTATGQTLRVFTVREWFDQFVKQKKKSRADKTARRHEQMMNEFIESLGEKADLNIAAVTMGDIVKFRDKREALGLSPATVNLDITILSSAFNSAWRQGHIPVNPCVEIEPLPDNDAEPKEPFSVKQVQALVNATSGDWRGLILTGFYLGARLGDCANLRWKYIDFAKHTVTYRPRKGKGKVETVLHPALEDYFLSLPTPESDEDYVFPTLAGRNISPLSKAFRQIMVDAHIKNRVIREKVGEHGRNVNALSFHSLRHSFTSILANAGVSEERRMALTGHTTRDVHQGYTHHELEVMRKEVSEALPRI
jgi:integrase